MAYQIHFIGNDNQLQLQQQSIKMVDKLSAPAFTMGSRVKDNPKDIFRPGPGAYDTISYLNTRKAYKVSNSKRFTEYTSQVPGPGTYQRKTIDHIPTATILSKSQQPKMDSLPGPGSYEPDYKKVIKSNSSYKLSLADRTTEDAIKGKNMPGPGQYQTSKSTLLKPQNAAKFGVQKRHTLALDKELPGPGQYNQTSYYNGSIANNPIISFSKSSRSQSVGNITPGPASYDLKGEFAELTGKKKGFSIKFRKSEAATDAYPGPGAYKTEDYVSTKKSNPSFSISKSPKLKFDNERQMLAKPSPITYSFNYSTFNGEHGPKMCQQKRKGLQNLNLVPGPGAYDTKTKSSERKYSIPKSQSSFLTNKASNPGPGSYDPKVIYNSQYEKIGLNKDERKPFYDEKKSIPGPGSYNCNDSTIPKGGYSIPHQKRNAERTQAGPGPGSYQLPSTVSNVPSYSGAKHK